MMRAENVGNKCGTWVKWLPVAAVILAVGGGAMRTHFYPPLTNLNTVNSTDDHDDGVCNAGDCTLREAITHSAADGTVLFDSSTFAAGGTILLSLGAIAIDHSLEIAGAGDGITIDAQGASRVFEITGDTVSIKRLTITHGYVLGEFGAAIWHESGSLTLTDCSVENNIALAGFGGGIASGSELQVDNCTFQGNRAQNGGGIYTYDSTATIVNSTFFGNEGEVFGGGLFTQDTYLKLINCTVTGNSAPSAGGIYNGGNVQMLNTIAAGNTATVGLGNEQNVGGANAYNNLDPHGYNIIGTLDGIVHGFSVSDHDMVNVDWKTVLENDGTDPILADNGGLTKTVALLAAGPAIDAGDDTALASAIGGWDQRGDGYSRLSGNHIDSGAFESPQTTEAESLTVTTTSDVANAYDGLTSLREALAYAHTLTGTPEITFDATVFNPATGPYTITPTGGQFFVDHNVTITGPGADVLTLDALGASRVLYFRGGTCQVSGLKMSGGMASGIGENGRGGAIYTHANLTLTECEISDSTASGEGGGISNHSTLTLDRSVVRGNTGAGGGGINNQNACALLNSTVILNTSTTGGGGLSDYGGVANLANCTFAGNQAQGGSGGGIESGGGGVAMINTIVAGNSASVADADVSGNFTSNGHNLIGEAGSVGAFYNNDIVEVDWKTVLANNGTTLTPANNGGPTTTVAPKTDSIAIDNGDDSVTGAPYNFTTDQRGGAFTRNQGSRVDIGAYESSQTAETPSLVVDTTNDALSRFDNATSLRDAIAFAENYGAGTTPEITFDPSVTGVITLTEGVLNITNRAPASFTITGPGANVLEISGNDASRIFNLERDVNLSGLTLAHGNFNGGSAIYVDGGNTVALTNSTVRDNLGKSAILNNGTFNITACTVSGNSGGDNGGAGLFNVNGVMTVINCTITGNQTTDYGGGIFNGFLGGLTTLNVTITGNTANAGGGGVFNLNSTPGSMVLRNTIVAGNTGDVDDDAAGVFDASSVNNLIGVVDSGLIGMSDGVNNNHLGVDWKTVFVNDGTTATLADNGGPTQTVALKAGSLAIDAGDDAVLTTPYDLTTDQRGTGYDRKLGNHVDIGAYEITLTPEAASLVVTTLNDTENIYDDKTSLREAVAYANSLGSSAGVTFDPSLDGGTITLGGSEITISNDINITGPDHGITLDANDSSRIFNVTFGTINLVNLTLCNGSAGEGGALYTLGTITLKNCLVRDNTATSYGGGIYNAGIVSLFNTTLYNNNGYYGAGLYVALNSVATYIENATITGNAASSQGGGVWAAANVDMKNTLVAGNTTGDVDPDIYGVFTSSGNNLIDNPGSVANLTNGTNGDIVGVDWKTVLANNGTSPTLAANGGSSHTVALATGSPALDAGDDAVSTTNGGTLEFDQRGSGFLRLKYSHVDIGAYEEQLEPSSLVVTTTIDTVDNSDGLTSLREAVTYANGGDAGASPEITFDATVFSPTGGPQAITPNSPIQIDHDLTITGPGAALLSIDGPFRLYIPLTHVVAVTDLTFSNNSDTSVLSESTGALTVRRCVFTDNSSVSSIGPVTVSDCAFVRNTANLSDGVIRANAGATITNCSFSEISNHHGAVLISGTGAITNCTFAQNSGLLAGGIQSSYGAVTIANCTFSDNNGYGGFGGAIRCFNSTVSLLNTVFVDNPGGNLGQQGTGGFTSLGHNLSDIDDSAILNATGDLNSTDPLLDTGGLADNGGFTKTIALQSGSPAKDAGDDAVLSAPYNLSTDGRGTGFNRKIGASVDIGAYEAPFVETPSLVVDTTSDVTDSSDDLTSLREAVAYANSNNAGTTPEITFDATVFAPANGPYTITLSGGELVLSHRMKISGPGARVLAVSGGGTNRVFNLNASGGISIDNLTLKNGNATGTGVAGKGGAIYNGNAGLSVTDCAFQDNSADVNGGGISTQAGIVLVRCTASGNSAPLGGGIFEINGGTFIHCTIALNTAGQDGGGLYSATQSQLYNCTIAGNTATTGTGGGIWTAAQLIMANTIVAGNSAGTANPDVRVSNDNNYTGSTHNLIGVPNALMTAGTGDIFGVDWKTVLANNGTILTLADNGGSTNTIALQSSGPAVDAGDDGFVASYPTDQRGTGYLRQSGTHVDIGAFEVVQTAETPSLVVDTTSDVTNAYDNLTTLREAVAYANSNNAGTTPEITFDATVFAAVNGPYSINLGSELVLAHRMNITGPGARVLAISGGGTHRVFNVTTGGGIHLTGLTLTNGKAAGTGAAGKGGALYNGDGDVNLTDCTVRDSSADVDGGGISNQVGLSLTRTTITGNSAPLGGGIFTEGGAFLSVNSTIALNTAGQDGGGLYNVNLATLINSTVAGNIATTGSGGGVHVTGGLVTMVSTIVAGNTAGAAEPDVHVNDDNAYESSDHNLIGVPDALMTAGTSDIFGVDWKTVLANNGTSVTLADNGGSTNTIALQSSGPAVDAASDSILAYYTTDQRGTGFARRSGTHVDIGAFELVQTLEAPSLVVNTTSDVTNAYDNLTTLREAVAYANSGNAPEVSVNTGPEITFDATVFAPANGPYTITLSGGELVLSHRMGISGPGARVLAVSGGGTCRVFNLTINGSIAINGLTLQNGKATGTGAAGKGGAIYNGNASLAITDCAIQDSSADVEGGGISSQGGLLLERCTVSGNSAPLGGGLFTNDPVQYINSTIADNTAGQGGGGLYSATQSLLYNCTIAGNSAGAGSGGGMYAEGGLQMTNTIIAGNTAGAADNDVSVLVDSVYLSGEHNFIGVPDALMTAGPGDIFGADWKTVLANNGTNVTLDNNGGSTNTIALRSGGPAVDAGTDYVAGIYTTDQRGTGYLRQSGTHVDIGAFEVVQTAETPSLVVDTTSDVTNAYDNLTTLREAVAYANSNNAGTTPEITFDATVFAAVNGPYTITLSGGELVLSHRMKISGPGARVLAISGGGTHRVFNSTTNGGIFINSLTLKNGKATGTGAAGKGGAIYNGNGALTLTDCTVRDSSADVDGGGISSQVTLLMERCTVTGNSAPLGGGIYNNVTGHLINSTIALNTAGQDGGGLYSASQSQLYNCTIAGNMATAGSGGGTWAIGQLQMYNTIVAGNMAGGADPDVSLSGSGYSGSNNLVGVSHALMDAFPGDILDVDWKTVLANNGAIVTLADNGGSTDTIALQEGGLAVDAGDDSVLVAYSTDQRGAGYVRKRDAAVDIGAYEGYIETSSLVVNTTGDVIDNGDGLTSLREALAYANSGSAPGSPPVVTFDATVFTPGSMHTITLVGSQLDIYDDVTVTGPGVDVLTVSGNDAVRVLQISGGTVSISGLTVAHGSDIGPVGGGGINIDPSGGSVHATLTDVVISNNKCFNYGAGLYSYGATVDLVRCVVPNNQNEFGTGGGIFNTSGGIMSLTDCTVDSNSTNSATGSSAGGVYNDSTLTITRSTISNNQASCNNGGGIYNTGSLLLTNSTVAGNSVGAPGNFGGGIFSDGGSLTVVNCTVTGNAATGGGGFGGGIFTDTITMLNSIVAGNTTPGGQSPDIFDSVDVTDLGGHNLIGDAQGSANAFVNGTAGDIVGIDWKTVLVNNGTTATLATNGGPTKTIALRAGSPARNAGDDSVLSAPYSLATEQRGAGFSRKRGTHVDMGALEMRNDKPVATPMSVSVYTDRPGTITLAGTDANGDALTFRLASRPMAGVRLYNGTNNGSPLIGSGVTLPFKLSGNEITYVSKAGYVGSDSFTFVAHDGELLSAAATVTINVLAPVAPSVAITSPTANQQFNDTAVTTITGTVKDNSPLHNGIGNVDLYLLRANPASAGFEYWSGGVWTVYPSSAAAETANARLSAQITGNPTIGATWSTIDALPAGLLDTGDYTVKAVAIDNTLQRATTSVIFHVASGAPTLTIGSPTEGQQFNDQAIGAVNGTVTDNSPGQVGINRVGAYLYRRNPANTGYEYWNGTAWTLYATSSQAEAGGARRAVAITGSNWAIDAAALPTGLQATGRYYVAAQAFDKRGLGGVMVYRSFIVRSGAPSLTITHPTQNQALGNLPLSLVDGTVTDNSPTQVGINKVVLSLYRAHTGGGYEYWTGTTWTVFASSTLAEAGGAALATSITGGTAWSCTATLPSSLELSTYLVRAYAVDNAGLKSAVAYRSFTATPDAPLVTIGHPTANQVLTDSAISALDGTVTDKSSGHVGINRVEVHLFRTHNGGGFDFWNGTAWTFYANSAAATTANARVAAVVSGSSWSCAAALPAGLQDSGDYTVWATAFDNNGIASTKANCQFKIVNGKPTVTIDAPSQNQNVGSAPLTTIDGTVTDFSPHHVGINKVVLALYRARTGGGSEYWTGTAWTYYPNLAAAVADSGALATEIVEAGGGDSYIWRCTATLPTGLTAGAYHVVAYAIDNTNVTGPAVGVDFTNFGGVPAPGQPGGLSTATASAAAGTVSLTFSTALDADSATDAARYTVNVNGQPQTVAGVTYSGGKVTVVLAGGLHANDQVQVAWSDVQNATGRSLSGATSTLSAH